MSFSDWSKLVILAIWLVEKYCFGFVGKVKKINVKFGVINEFLLTAENRLYKEFMKVASKTDKWNEDLAVAEIEN